MVEVAIANLQAGRSIEANSQRFGQANVLTVKLHALPADIRFVRAVHRPGRAADRRAERHSGVEVQSGPCGAVPIGVGWDLKGRKQSAHAGVNKLNRMRGAPVRSLLELWRGVRSSLTERRHATLPYVHGDFRVQEIPPEVICRGDHREPIVYRSGPTYETIRRSSPAVAYGGVAQGLYDRVNVRWQRPQRRYGVYHALTAVDQRDT
ncbi:hypothetical protein D3C76_908890 [compost metagenome]